VEEFIWGHAIGWGRRSLLFAVVLIFATSCISNKKVLFLQKNDVNTDISPKDSVLRTYDLVEFEYKLQPGDVLSIQFQSLTPEEYDFFSTKTQAGNTQTQNPGTGTLSGFLIDYKGEIEFPVAGKIKVEGLTIFEARDVIRDVASDYLESPVTELRLLNFRFTILGEVKGEGIYNSFNDKISIMEAIGLSGGFTDLADRKNVKVVRHREGNLDVYYINLLEEEFLASTKYFVHQNDLLVVPPLKQRPFRKYFGPNLSLILSSISLFIIVVDIVTR